MQKKDQLEKFDTSWQEIFGKDGIIPTRQSQAFLRNFLMLKDGHVSNNQVYDVCKSYLTDNKATEDFLVELFVFSEFYRNITVVSEIVSGKVINHVNDDEIAELLFLLNKTKVRQWQSVVLALYKYYDNSEIKKVAMEEILLLLLKISVRFKILDKRFNVIEKKMPTLARTLHVLEIEEEIEGKKEKRAISSEEAIELVTEQLNSVLEKNVPDDELFTVLNNGYLFDDNDLAFIVLRLIANRHMKHGLTFSITKKLSLEHVLPEKHKEHWGEIDDVETLKYSIGNMLLIDLPENAKLSNKPFDDKKKQYIEIKPLDFVSTEKLSYMNANQETWVGNFIKDRGTDLIKQLKDVI